MAISAVSICSNALQMLGDKAISSFEDNTDSATLCKNLYPLVRDYLLRSHHWLSCRKRVVLSPETSTPAFDWLYSFLLPNDFLRIVQVGQKDDRPDFATEGRKILMNESVLYLVYTFNNADEGTYDASLVYALTECMKAAIAYAITQSTSKMELDYQLMERTLKKIRALNAQDEPAETLGDFPIYNSRF